MRPPQVERDVTVRGVLDQTAFNMRAENAKFVFTILRSSLYPNKELAPLREYSTNAWDAHVAAGIHDKPIKVTLPTVLAPELVIRDYGTGLCHEDVKKYFSGYGESSKRESDDSNGFMGIGAKSGFAYADVYSVTSYYQGVRSGYTCVIDETDLGQLIKQFEEPCGDETGVEVKIPVASRDFATFANEARALFGYFDPLPTINLTEPLKPVVMGEHGFINPINSNHKWRYGRGYGRGTTWPTWKAVMGCIPYKLDFSQMESELLRAGLADVASGSMGALRFPLGTIAISASREEVQYTPLVKAAIVEKLGLLVAELSRDLEKVMLNPTATAWERRLALLDFEQRTGLPSRDAWAHMSKEVVDAPRSETFLLYGRKPVRGDRNARTKTHVMYPKVHVVPTTRLLIQDTKKGLAGFKLGEADVVVRPQDGVEVPKVEEALGKVLNDLALTGVPVVYLSAVPHTRDSAPPKVRTPRGQRNVKLVKKQFQLLPHAFANPIYSQMSLNWEIVERDATVDDVFVVLNGFYPRDSGSFFLDIAAHSAALKAFGFTLPNIYGYRHTAARPVDEKELVGTPYAAWWEKTSKALMESKEFKQIASLRHWSDALSIVAYGHSSAGELLKSVQAQLTAEHAISVFIKKAQDSKKAYDATDKAKKFAAERLTRLQLNLASASSVVPEPSTVEAELAVLLKRYPLLDRQAQERGFGVFAATDAVTACRSTFWFDYIKSQDLLLEKA